MQSSDLSREEQERATEIKENYRQKYMCGMGPIIDDMINKSLEKQSWIEKLRTMAEDFLNTTYFSTPGKNNLPTTTMDLFSFNIYQEQTRIKKIIKDEEVLVALLEGAVIVNTDVEFERDFIHKIKLDVGKFAYKYQYLYSIKFCTLEQVFLFLRAFWYFVEAKVLFELLGEELSDQGRELLKQYVILRKSLIKPFMSDEFEKNRFSSNLEENNKNKLNMYFDKWFFSNSKIVNRKCLMLSRMITNEME